MKKLEELSQEIILTVLSNTKHDDDIEYLQSQEGTEVLEYLKEYILEHLKAVHNLGIDKCIENAEFFVSPSYKGTEGDIIALDRESLEQLKS